MRQVDIVGKAFGRLTVLSTEPKRNGESFVLCRCECGTEKAINKKNLMYGKTLSCGCLLQEHIDRGLRYKHGGQGTVEYRLWKSMKSRCYNPNRKEYENYGSRGITVCDRWLHDFSAFLTDMGLRPSEKHSLERKDNDLGYSPENCYWATRTQQNNNTRRTVRHSYQGQSYTVGELARKFALPYKTIYIRLKNGWSVEESVTIPVRPVSSRPITYS